MCSFTCLVLLKMHRLAIVFSVGGTIHLHHHGWLLQCLQAEALHERGQQRLGPCLSISQLWLRSRRPEEGRLSWKLMYIQDFDQQWSTCKMYGFCKHGRATAEASSWGIQIHLFLPELSLSFFVFHRLAFPKVVDVGYVPVNAALLAKMQIRIEQRGNQEADYVSWHILAMRSQDFRRFPLKGCPHGWRENPKVLGQATLWKVTVVQQNRPSMAWIGMMIRYESIPSGNFPLETATSFP